MAGLTVAAGPVQGIPAEKISELASSAAQAAPITPEQGEALKTFLSRRQQESMSLSNASRAFPTASPLASVNGYFSALAEACQQGIISANQRDALMLSQLGPATLDKEVFPGFRWSDIYRRNEGLKYSTLGFSPGLNRALNSSLESVAADLYNAMHGFETDRGAIFEVLMRVSKRSDREQFTRVYENNYKIRLSLDLRSNLPDRDAERAMALLETGHVKN